MERHNSCFDLFSLFFQYLVFQSVVRPVKAQKYLSIHMFINACTCNDTFIRTKMGVCAGFLQTVHVVSKLAERTLTPAHTGLMYRINGSSCLSSIICGSVVQLPERTSQLSKKAPLLFLLSVPDNQNLPHNT